MDLKETDILGDDIAKHWYYKNKAKALKKMVGDKTINTILDIGAGSGFFSKYLLNGTSAEEAWCVDVCYSEDSDNIDSGKFIHYRKQIETCNADLVLLMDVLEHVDDDVGLLSEYVKRVPVGSTFIISVPAFQYMWSGHDVFLEHKRRYTLAQIESVVRDAGLILKSSAYYFGTVFPLAAASRFAGNLLNSSTHPQSQLKKHSVLANTALSLLCDLELPFFKKNKVLGLTAFCSAIKS